MEKNSIRHEIKKTHTIIVVWMTCDFTSFSAVFQSRKYDKRMTVKCNVQQNHVSIHFGLTKQLADQELFSS